MMDANRALALVSGAALATTTIFTVINFVQLQNMRAQVDHIYYLEKKEHGLESYQR